MTRYTWHTLAKNSGCIFHMIKLITLLISSVLLLSSAYASETSIYKKSAAISLDEAFNSVYLELEERNFYVVFEANIGNNISRFKEKWGDEYNQNKLGGIRSMVFCNGWFANKVSNLDPDMLALCPLRLTVIEHSGQSHILFVKPSIVGKESPALNVLNTIEQTVIEAINAAME